MSFPWKALVAIILLAIVANVIFGWWWAILLAPPAGLILGYQHGRRRARRDREVDQ